MPTKRLTTKAATPAPKKKADAIVQAAPTRELPKKRAPGTKPTGDPWLRAETKTRPRWIPPRPDWLKPRGTR